MSRRLQMALGVGLGGGLIYLFLRQADLAGVGRALRMANPWYIVAAVVAVLFNQLQRAWRWHFLLRPLGRVRTRPLLECTLIGWGVSLVLPGRLGELARPVSLSRRTSVPASAAIGSVVLERAFDGLTVLVMLGVYLAFFPPPTGLDAQGRLVLETMRTTGMLMLAGLVVVGTMTVLAMRSARMRAFVNRMSERWLPGPVGKLAASFMAGMAGLRSPMLIAAIALNSLLLWGNILLIYVLLFSAFDIDLPAYASMPLVAVLVIGVMVPTPGAVGGFHKAAQIGLVNMWGVDNTVAVAYAIVAHAVGFLPHGILGLILLAREGLSLGAVRRLGNGASGKVRPEV